MLSTVTTQPKGHGFKSQLGGFLIGVAWSLGLMWRFHSSSVKGRSVRVRDIGAHPSGHQAYDGLVQGGFLPLAQ